MVVVGRERGGEECPAPIPPPASAERDVAGIHLLEQQSRPFGERVWGKCFSAAPRSMVLPERFYIGRGRLLRPGDDDRPPTLHSDLLHARGNPEPRGLLSLASVVSLYISGDGCVSPLVALRLAAL